MRFADGVRTLDALGVARQIEIGPGSTLTALARTITDTPVAPALRAKRPEPEAFANLIAHAHLTGLTPDWHALHPTAQRVDLPTYAFQGERYWLSGAGTGNVEGAGLIAVGHPLLGAAVALAGKDEWLLTGRLSLAAQPWIADHKVFDTVLVPGTALVELALAAGERTGCPTVSELTLEAPLVVESDVEVQVIVGERDDDGLRSIEIHARAGEADWVRHAAGVLSPETRRGRGAGRALAARGRRAARHRGALRPPRRAGLRLRAGLPGRDRRLAARRGDPRRGGAGRAPDRRRPALRRAPGAL